MLGGSGISHLRNIEYYPLRKWDTGDHSFRFFILRSILLPLARWFVECTYNVDLEKTAGVRVPPVRTVYYM